MGSNDHIEDDLSRAVDEFGDDDHVVAPGISRAGDSQGVGVDERIVC